MNDIPEHVAAVLESADWIVVNSSAGKDSQAMLDLVVATADRIGVPRSRLVVVHADLGRVEWPGTRELAEEQARHYGLRFEAVHRRTAGGERQTLLEHVRARGKWPSSTARYCTSDMKRGPVRTLLTRLAAETRADGKTTPAVIVNCMGLRADESPARAKKAAWELDEAASNGRRIVYQWLPIHAWTTAQVWDRIRSSGVRHHPAYDLGMPRLSCCFCIFAPRDALVLAGRHNPELLDEYVEVERAIGHRFRVSLSLAEVQAAVEAGEEPATVVSWAM